MHKKYYTWKDVHKAATSIAMQMYKDNWRPDYIVGITRGGLPLATILSHLTSIPMETLKVSLRDDRTCNGPESNLWMSEDAFGWDCDPRNILVVDDINDTGSTFKWIQADWAKSVPGGVEKWNTIWDNNVRFAVMTENLSSEFGQVRYHYDEVNKAEDDVWLVYPYEAQ